jgi:hypothetical protein
VYTLRTLAASNEAIAYQTDSFFHALTEVFRKIYTHRADIENHRDKFFENSRVQEIAEVIKTYTNLKVKLIEGDFACMPTTLSENSVLGPKEPEMFEFITRKLSPSLYRNEVSEAIKEIGKNFVSGQVDLKNARVGGVFAEISSFLLFPRDALTSGSFSPEEIAAITLHEVGHLFTHLEYLDRIVGTNQSIACLLKVLDDREERERTLIFHEYGKAVEMNDEDIEKLVSCKDPLSITYIVANHYEGKIKSEFGLSDYDSVNSEFLADQFSARCGAGKYIVTVLDKMMKGKISYTSDGSMVQIFPDMWKYVMFNFAQMVLKFIIACKILAYVSNFISVIVGILILVFKLDNTDTYDVAHERFDRVRQQNTERLKNRNLNIAIRKNLIDQNEAIEVICKSWENEKFGNDKDLGVVLALILRPKYRRERDFRLLQIKLQEIAFNKMFDRAAKLRLI